MTPEEQALLGVVRLLESLDVPYMIVGSIASSHHGRPRSTHDADVVIDPAPRALDTLVQRLADSGFYVDARRAREAMALRRQFNVIDTESASKVDLIFRKERPFSKEEFGRRYRAQISEDVRAIWPGGGHRRLRWVGQKVGRVRKTARRRRGHPRRSDDLDRGYIARWAEALGVTDLWERALQGRP
jgi:hypothetical protein